LVAKKTQLSGASKEEQSSSSGTGRDFFFRSAEDANPWRHEKKI
jgi:hypothetical protein